MTESASRRQPWGASLLVWGQHAVGAVDHHFMELSWVLGVLALGLGWAREPQSGPRALGLGVALGLALVFHHGLFVLQLPMDLWLFVCWLRGRLPGTVGWLAGGLIGATLLACLPSPQFRDGLFSAYFLSWFHLYVAAGSSLMLLLLARLRPSIPGLLWLGLAAVVLLLMMLGQIRSGLQFVAGRTLLLDQVDETVGLWQKLAMGQGMRMLKAFTLLLPLAPLFLLWLLWHGRRDTALQLLVVFALFGLGMFALQVRFHYLALPGLVFPMLLAAQAWLGRADNRRDGGFRLGAVLVMAVLFYLPSLGTVSALEKGGSRHYASGLPLFRVLETECAAVPGVVLTDYEYGHFIRYHTDCGVVGNSMMLTPLQQRKIAQGREMLGWDLARLRAEAPWVRYLLLRHSPQQPDGPLRRALLESAVLPSGVEFLGQVVLNEGRRSFPYARLFRIDPQASDPPHLQDAHQEAGQDGLETEGGEQ